MLKMSETLIKVENLKKWFPLKMGFFQSFLSQKALFVHAIDGIRAEYC
jgi:peptide/nickel transport system ATP-binding protein